VKDGPIPYSDEYESYSSSKVRVRITTKGQVTIPQHIRERFGLLPHTEVEFVVEGDTVRIERSESGAGESRGQRVLRQMRSSGAVTMTTDEIMSLTRGE